MEACLSKKFFKVNIVNIVGAALREDTALRDFFCFVLLRNVDAKHGGAITS